jgi:tetratricopeptide (TPR) repeat protein
VNGYLFLAARYQDLGMLDQALQTLNDGLSADPNSVLVLKQRGLLYIAMDKKDLARQDLTKAIAAMPDDYDLKTALETIK